MSQSPLWTNRHFQRWAAALLLCGFVLFSFQGLTRFHLHLAVDQNSPWGVVLEDSGEPEPAVENDGLDEGDGIDAVEGRLPQRHLSLGNWRSVGLAFLEPEGWPPSPRGPPGIL